MIKKLICKVWGCIAITRKVEKNHRHTKQRDSSNTIIVTTYENYCRLCLKELFK